MKTWFKKLIAQFDSLDNKIETQGYITKDDILNLSLPRWLNHLMVFCWKRSTSEHILYDYRVANQRFEYLDDVPENLKSHAKLCFYRPEESNSPSH